jgi:tryptophan synthase beta chain
MFHPFVYDTQVRLTGVEAAGTGQPGCYHSATLNQGSPGVLHGTKTYLLQTREGQILPSESIAPGLDYPGVGPEHVQLQEKKRVSYVQVNDHQALQAFHRLSRTEGIIPALESAHAVAYALSLEDLSPTNNVVVNLSGRGDKDLDLVQTEHFQMEESHEDE